MVSLTCLFIMSCASMCRVVFHKQCLSHQLPLSNSFHKSKESVIDQCVCLLKSITSITPMCSMQTSRILQSEWCILLPQDSQPQLTKLSMHQGFFTILHSSFALPRFRWLHRLCNCENCHVPGFRFQKKKNTHFLITDPIDTVFPSHFQCLAQQLPCFQCISNGLCNHVQSASFVCHGLLSC